MENMLQANKKRYGGMQGHVGESETLSPEAREFRLSKKRALCDPRRLDDVFKDALPSILYDFEMPTRAEIISISRTSRVEINSYYEHNSLIYNATLSYGSYGGRFDRKSNTVRYLKFTLANNDYVYADLENTTIPTLMPPEQSTRHLHHYKRVSWDVIQDTDSKKSMPAIHKFQRDFFGDDIKPEMYYNCANERVDLCFTVCINQAGDKLQLEFCFENQYPDPPGCYRWRSRAITNLT